MTSITLLYRNLYKKTSHICSDTENLFGPETFKNKGGVHTCNVTAYRNTVS